MNCKSCNKTFEVGEMLYENGGKNPLCYPCAEKGSLTAVAILVLAIILYLAVLFGVSYLRGDYDSIEVRMERLSNTHK